LASLEPPPENLLRPLFPLYEYLFRPFQLVNQADPSMVLTSWFRSPEKNREVGGSEQSQHLFGFALDAITDQPEFLVEAATRAGLVAVEEMDHVHVQLFPAGFLRSIGLFIGG